MSIWGLLFIFWVVIQISCYLFVAEVVPVWPLGALCDWLLCPFDTSLFCFLEQTDLGDYLQTGELQNVITIEIKFLRINDSV